jgi:hypothetical protein
LVLVGCVIDFFDGGLALRLILLLSHLLFGFKEDRVVPCLVICISLVKHVIYRSIMKLTPPSPSVCIAASKVVILSSRIEGPAPIF